MLVYLGVILIVVLAAFLARESKSHVISRGCYLIAFVSMVLVAGLRDRTVGTDTPTYLHFFDSIRSPADVVQVGSEMGEYGFWTLTWLVHFISDDYAVYLLVIAIIVVACYQWVIIAHSENVLLSLLIFITIESYFFFFNGARQGIASAVYALGVGAMLERKPGRYIAYVLLASMFHQSAIVMLPVYLIFNRPNTFKNNLVIALIGCAAAVAFTLVSGEQSIVDTRYSVYLDPGEGGGYFMVGISAVFAMFFLMFKRSVTIQRERYDLLLNMILFGLMIGMVSSILNLNPSGLLRYRVYFEIAGVLIWPIVFKNIHRRGERLAFAYMFVVYCFVMFTMTTSQFGNLAPYKFNSSLQLLK